MSITRKLAAFAAKFFGLFTFYLGTQNAVEASDTWSLIGRLVAA